MEDEYLTVSQINSYIKKKLSRDMKLKNIYVKGEISNYKSYSSGHSYFTLKDDKTEINAMLPKYNKRFLNFEIENGMNVIIKGSIDVYEKDGKYQLIARRITEDGLGDFHVALEQLKKKLRNEGLFDKSHKKEIPKYPKKIGVITSQKGSVLKDIITTTKRRFPLCKILIFPTLVQGDSAIPQLISQIKHAQKYDLDTIIIARGGGSVEDLWVFNDETLVREIYNCKIPIISAIGHETDNTLSDLVSDLRAPTPTAAAELAMPNINEIKDKINHLKIRADKQINNKIIDSKLKLKNLSEKQVLKDPESIYEIKAMHLDSLISKIEYKSDEIISKNRHHLNELKNSYILKNPVTIYKAKSIQLNNTASKLESESNKIIMQNKHKLDKIKNTYILKNPHKIIKGKKENYIKNLDKLEILNPLLTLKRGYSITKLDEKIITSSDEVNVGDELEIELKDGKIKTKVI